MVKCKTSNDCTPLSSLKSKVNIVLLVLAFTLISNITSLGIAYTASEKSSRNERAIERVVDMLVKMDDKLGEVSDITSRIEGIMQGRKEGIMQERKEGNNEIRNPF